MDAESGPIRCDSSLSVVKIQTVAEQGKGGRNKRLLAKHKFSDPEIEELYQLHSANQKKTELFRCFLYCILFYSLVHIVVYAAWIGRNPVVFGGAGGEEEDHHHDRYEGGGGHPVGGDGMVTQTGKFSKKYIKVCFEKSRIFKKITNPGFIFFSRLNCSRNTGNYDTPHLRDNVGTIS